MAGPAVRTAVALCLLVAGAAGAHEHWILIQRKNGKAVLQIGSGHCFPVSDLRLAERLLTETVILHPSGGTTNFKPVASDTTWMAEWMCDTPGVWSAAFALKKPQDEEPFYRARALLIVGEADDPSRYAIGKGLEIVPQTALSALKPGDTLRVAIHENGAPIEGKITVTPEAGRVAFLSTGQGRPAEVKLPSAGAYLLTTSRRGRTFALTVTVGLPTEKMVP